MCGFSHKKTERPLHHNTMMDRGKEWLAECTRLLDLPVDAKGVQSYVNGNRDRVFFLRQVYMIGEGLSDVAREAFRLHDPVTVDDDLHRPSTSKRDRWST